MKYACTACGGRGPHDGFGHAYTTDPDFRNQERRRLDRLAQRIGESASVSPMGKFAVALAVATSPDPGPNFWAERDGGPAASGFDLQFVEMPRTHATALLKRSTGLGDMLARTFTEATMQEVRAVLTLVNLALDSALTGDGP